MVPSDTGNDPMSRSLPIASPQAHWDSPVLVPSWPLGQLPGRSWECPVSQGWLGWVWLLGLHRIAKLMGKSGKTHGKPW